jgi:hypothetical protein
MKITRASIAKEEFEDTKGAIRIRISRKNRQHNGQKKKDKQRSIKQYITQKSKDRATRTSLKTKMAIDSINAVDGSLKKKLLK